MRLSLRNSNTSRDRRTKIHWSSNWLLAALAFVCFANAPSTLGANKVPSQYIRDEWGTEQGFPGGPVHAIAQTPDGYLWIGTEKGLVRFDGLSFRLFQQFDSTTLPGGPVIGLAVDAEGDLWIRLQGPRLLNYRDGTFRDVLPNPGLVESDVTAMCVASNGGILFSGLTNGIVRYSKGKFEPLASTTDLPRLVISLAETADGKVWMGTREQGLYYLDHGRVTAITKGLPDKKINSLLAIGSGDLWISTDNGIGRWNGSEISSPGTSRALDRTQVLATIRDRNSNVWVGTANGLFRIDARGVPSIEEGDNRSTEAVTALFEDREGNLWVGTPQGIERLRERMFTTYSVSGGLPSESIGPVYVDPEGRAWFAPLQGGLYWLKDGHVGRVSIAGLDTSAVYSISGRQGELWIGRRQGGITHLRYNGDAFTTETYTQSHGLAQNSVYAVHQNRDGTVWAGTLSAGLSRFKNGSFTTFTTANGLASNTIDSILEASDGTMWFGTPNGLSALSKGQWRIYTSRDGLPPGTVNCLLEDSAGVLWIGTANGLAFINSGTIQALREVPESLHEQVYGIEEDEIGALWMATSNHVLRVNRDKLLGLVVSEADVREYGFADGLSGLEGVKRYRSVVTDSLGRVWFATNRGISSINPTRVMASSAPAIVHVEGIAADGRRFGLGGQIRVPAPHQRITLSYAGLSLAVPARIRFKYKLDGLDPGWSEPTAAHEASYTNLGSGSYLFHVVASNSDGLWNSSESTLRFEIEPVFWQTWWFQLSSVLAVGLAILMFYRLRVLRLSRQMNMRFEERLAERTRIAQELHDTLLQGFLSASMQLHVADDHLATDSPAKPLVGRVLELMGTVIDEGRNAVRGLRLPYRESEDLAQALARIQQELGVAGETGFHVVAEGVARPLRPAIREEVYRVGREALVNAFRHSRASSIEVELEYAPSHLRLLVRDNGSGIDPEVVRAGREGHWGLSGMRERAERIGGRLRVMSSASAGTEIELSVPSHIAYLPRDSGRPSKWLNMLQPRKAKGTESSIESERVG
jgi:ligand-binding sensor domain-containing protein/signal transduction histidine kinase